MSQNWHKGFSKIKELNLFPSWTLQLTLSLFMNCNWQNYAFDKYTSLGKSVGGTMSTLSVRIGLTNRTRISWGPYSQKDLFNFPSTLIRIISPNISFCSGFLDQTVWCIPSLYWEWKVHQRPEIWTALRGVGNLLLSAHIYYSFI